MGEIIAHQRAAADSTCSFTPEAAEWGLYSVNGVRQQLQLLNPHWKLKQCVRAFS